MKKSPKLTDVLPSSGGLQSTLGNAKLAATVRKRYKGENLKSYRARMEREEIAAEELRNDPRRSGGHGRVMPVRYDD